MEPLRLNPKYSVYIVLGNDKYNVTPALLSIDRSDDEKQIAQHVRMEFENVLVDGILLSSLLKPISRVFVHADDGSKDDEVFRGFLWSNASKTSTKAKTLKVDAYDNLIYMQESEDTFFFSSGNSTKTIVSKICSDWGIKLEYSYTSITHGQLALTGRLYDLLTADVLEDTRKQTGDYYTLISVKDTMIVRKSGTNTDVYQFIKGKNVSAAASGWTMDGVTTKIIILGDTDDNGWAPVKYTESKNTDIYGTLQKIERTSSDKDAQKEAKITLQEDAEPKWEYEIEGPDVPWIRKGDAVVVDVGDINDRRLIVTSISRSSDNKKSNMTMTMVDATKRTDLLKV